MSQFWRGQILLWGGSLLLLNFTAAAATLLRGPYLQKGTPTSITLRWRTDSATDSRVRYGAAVTNLNRNVVDTTQTTEHHILLSGLMPDTKYYYSIGGNNQTFGGGPDFFFLTAPTHAKPTRIWVLGDAGTRTINQRAVRDAYYAFTDRHTDLWLMLGDNAYGSGYDWEYQGAVFNMYPHMLRKSVLWPCLGNHDTYGDFSYAKIFSLPTAGEAGGSPSGTKLYYSFNYANIHFVVLDSMLSDRSSNGPMCTWLATDLADNTNDWVFAYWHHPPYSKGSHDSDSEDELIEMRENVLPILESFGVDLVMSGHSHSYERSYLLQGHYGFSDELVPDLMIKDNGSGRESDTGPYRTETESGRGTVYVVAGSSGQISGGDLNHLVMFISLNQLGSFVLDVHGPRLDATFLRANGAIGDTFTLLKPGADARVRITSFTVTSGIMRLVWTSVPGRTYYVERSTSLSSPHWETISPGITANDSTTEWSTLIEPDPSLFFRVIYYQN